MKLGQRIELNGRIFVDRQSGMKYRELGEKYNMPLGSAFRRVVEYEEVLAALHIPVQRGKRPVFRGLTNE